MAEVFQAHVAKAPDKDIAIKRILPQFLNNKELVSTLVHEASVSVMLEHPNIVPVYDFGLIDQSYFLAMEYIRGKDLRSIVSKVHRFNKGFPVSIAIYIMTQVLRGLDYAHQKKDQYGRHLQIIHRDISVQNIMLSFSGQVKILDFGIAKIAAKNHDEGGVLKGKFSFMSPEQAFGKDIDPRSDIFSAGIVLWELLTNEYCFKGKNDLDVLKAVRLGEVTPAHVVNPKISTELSSLVMKALAKKPQDRYPTAGLFADELEKHLSTHFGKVNHQDIIKLLKFLFPIEYEKSDGQSEPLQEENTSAASNIYSSLDELPWLKKKKNPILKAAIYLSFIPIFFALYYTRVFNQLDRWISTKAYDVRAMVGLEKKYSGITHTLLNPNPRQLPLHYSAKAMDMLDDIDHAKFDDLVLNVLYANIDLNKDGPQLAKNNHFQIQFKLNQQKTLIEIIDIKN